MCTEEPLAGGNTAAVWRVGDTVRREAGAWTPQVQALLAHLRASGIREVPAPLGVDAAGREVLSFIPGVVGHHPLPDALRSDAALAAAARLLRRIHDASAEIAQAWPAGWRAPTRHPIEVICHGDFAPYNCVFDGAELVGVIDFDHAHPGEREWDLAYAIYRFAPIADPANPESYGSLAEQCRRLRLFCDQYGLADRSTIVGSIWSRVMYMADYLRQGAAQGDRQRIANIAAGHLAIYTADAAYLAAHSQALQAALADRSF